MVPEFFRSKEYTNKIMHKFVFKKLPSLVPNKIMPTNSITNFTTKQREHAETAAGDRWFYYTKKGNIDVATRKFHQTQPHN